MTKTKCGTLALVLVACLFASKASAFEIISKRGHEVRWKKMPVKYYVGEDLPLNFKAYGYDGRGEYIEVSEIIHNAFKTWKSTESVDIDYSYQGKLSMIKGGDDGKNTISFVSRDWMEQDFNPPPGALAVTVTTYDTGSGYIVDSDIYFNDEYYNWGHIDTAEEYAGSLVDIQNIATHEIGHVFGLAHSSESPFESSQELLSATMYYSSRSGETFRRFLNYDDRNAIRHLYPTDKYEKTVPEPAVTDIYPNEGYNTGDELAVKVEGRYLGPMTMIKITGGDMVEDEVCKITAHYVDSVECVFDLYNVSRGQYDVVIANSYDKTQTLSKAFTVHGREIEYENASSGGCGRIDEDGGKRGLALLGLIILIYPITFLPARKRALARAKINRR